MHYFPHKTLPNLHACLQTVALFPDFPGVYNDKIISPKNSHVNISQRTDQAGMLNEDKERILAVKLQRVMVMVEQQMELVRG